jgi:hypothetical protein
MLHGKGESLLEMIELLEIKEKKVIIGACVKIVIISTV